MNNSTIFIKGKIVPTIKIKGKTNASIIRIYPELENIEITPTLEDQKFKSEMYGFNEINVKGVSSYIDGDIKPEYIKEGVDILGVVGNVIELQGEEKTVVPTREQQEILPSEGKNAITKITVQPVDRTIDEDIKPENIIDGVEILGVVGNYKGIDTSDATVTPDKVLAGTTVYINNEKIEGTLPNNGELEFTPSDELQIVPEGYTSGGIVSAADITALNEYNACLTLANSIEDLEDYSDTTATAEDIVEGKTAYSNGEKITGILKVGKDITSEMTSFSFAESKTVEEVNLSDISNISSLGSAFKNCTNLKKVSLKKAQKLSSATYMFQNCTSLETVEIEDANNLMSVSYMFNNCSKLETAPQMDFRNVTVCQNVFNGCTNLKNVPVYNIPKPDTIYRMFYNCSNLTDESLNNILLTCINAIKIASSIKTLQQVGLTSDQATRCQSLSNYQAFLDAGWTTGY